MVMVDGPLRDAIAAVGSLKSEIHRERKLQQVRQNVAGFAVRIYHEHDNAVPLHPAEEGMVRLGRFAIPGVTSFGLIQLRYAKDERRLSLDAPETFSLDAPDDFATLATFHHVHPVVMGDHTSDLQPDMARLQS